MRRQAAVLGLALLGAFGFGPAPAGQPAGQPASGACFLLTEIGVGELRRSPSEACALRVTPASTFKVPHALAALDAGVLSGPDAAFDYDGSPQRFAAWRQPHTLRTAMRDSVVWYFQRIAERLGAAREQDYLTRFRYGNADPTSGLTTFWIGGSLVISPEEQQRFILDLFAGRLPAGQAHQATVRQIMIQPPGFVTNAMGRTPFGRPGPGVVVSAKTGSARDRSGAEVRWIVGHVARGARQWTFVSLVTGGDDTPATAAISQAAGALTEAGVFDRH